MSSADASVRILGDHGVFAEKITGFTPRPSQQAMAHAVAETLDKTSEQSNVLVAESGTGTGKTFAYLVPVIHSGSKTILSTGTRHLQDQLFHRDLPRVLDLLGKPRQAVLLKGRRNYLCLQRWQQLGQQSRLLEASEASDYQQIEKWLQRTASGDIAELQDVDEDALILRDITVNAERCLGSQCPDFQDCYVMKARKQAAEADIVVVNHHLFFSDIALKSEGFGELLPDYDAVVFDEAHHLPAVASQFYGYQCSTRQILDLLGDVVDINAAASGVMDFDAVIKPLQVACHELQNSVDEEQTERQLKVDYVDEAQADRLAILNVALKAFVEALNAAVSDVEELERAYDRGIDMLHNLQRWQRDDESEMVKWVEARTSNCRFGASPLSIAEQFRNLLNDNPVSWVFTSATLAVEDDFTAFNERMGIDKANCQQWLSPYDYENHGLLLLPRNFPDPRDMGYLGALTELIEGVTRISKGRAFCLFTSFAMMNRVYENLQTSPWPILRQGEASKQALINRFLDTPNAVLLGTSSFWEGVDIPGQQLSCVIIDKLPFASLSDPVYKQRLAHVTENGGNAFMDVQVPEAVIALKQGIGRLIRAESDYGVLVLADSRVVQKRYGQQFLRSLPRMPITRNLDDVAQFFQRNDDNATHTGH